MQREKKAAFCDSFSQQGNPQKLPNSGAGQTVMLKAKKKKFIKKMKGLGACAMQGIDFIQPPSPPLI